mgnify:CR=1 FL=1
MFHVKHFFIGNLLVILYMDKIEGRTVKKEAEGVGNVSRETFSKKFMFQFEDINLCFIFINRYRFFYEVLFAIVKMLSSYFSYGQLVDFLLSRPTM